MQLMNVLKRLEFALVVAALFVAAPLLTLRQSGAQSFQVALQITSPTDGAVFHRGDTVTVVVTTTSGAGYQTVQLNTGPGLMLTQALGLLNPSGPPYQFSFTIPNNAVIGTHFVNAIAGTRGQQPVRSPDIHIDVEPSGAVASIKVQPSSISLGPKVGDHERLRTYATLGDGSVVDITQSTQITYTSSDPSIATVSDTGLVTAATSSNRGTTTVVVHFGTLNAGVSVSKRKIPRSP
jgi:uncharacterized protein YjdB